MTDVNDHKKWLINQIDLILQTYIEDLKEVEKSHKENRDNFRNVSIEFRKTVTGAILFAISLLLIPGLTELVGGSSSPVMPIMVAITIGLLLYVIWHVYDYLAIRKTTPIHVMYWLRYDAMYALRSEFNEFVIENDITSIRTEQLYFFKHYGYLLKNDTDELARLHKEGQNPYC